MRLLLPAWVLAAGARLEFRLRSPACGAPDPAGARHFRFHVENMTAPQAVEYLVTRVGHERGNSSAGVRRSVEDSSYDPVYQAAYLLGGLQIRALRYELVESGRIKDRQFHDKVVELHSIPIEMIRATLLKQPSTKNFVSTWRFYQ